VTSSRSVPRPGPAPLDVTFLTYCSQGTLYFSYYGGEKIAETINQLGFDALVLGNHEFDRGEDHLTQFVRYRFPVTSPSSI